jgi:hypothetical protein
VSVSWLLFINAATILPGRPVGRWNWSYKSIGSPEYVYFMGGWG